VAERLDLARLSNHGVALIERRAPLVAFGPARVVVPAGGFLQATATGEETLAKLAAEALKGSARVADLFCGAGAFALRLAGDHSVFAADNDAAAIAALRRATTGGIEATARDLVRQPLSAAELARFDAVLFDPPRAGASAQAREIAASAIMRVVAISCNAETFARDARSLVDGGYVCESVTPIDQFRYSAHVEIFAAFRRARAKRRRSILG
jgi:23S rRNA (uracil1939-C5)-methyltransferase